MAETKEELSPLPTLCIIQAQDGGLVPGDTATYSGRTPEVVQLYISQALAGNKNATCFCLG